MRRVTISILPVLVSAFIGLSAHAGEFKTFRGTVTKITDGDTIHFRPNTLKEGEKDWTIRMISTDTAETHLPAPGGMVTQGYWGDKGAEKLGKLLALGETVEVDSYGVDVHNRVLGRIYKRGNVDVNLEMLRSGWAALYIICDRVSCDERADYRKACDSAMDRRVGLFNPNKRLPMLPFIFRSIHQKRPLAKFVGNVRTHRYYDPTDYGKVPLCDRTFFMTKTDAKRAGYVYVGE